MPNKYAVTTVENVKYTWHFTPLETHWICAKMKYKTSVKLFSCHLYFLLHRDCDQTGDTENILHWLTVAQPPDRKTIQVGLLLKKWRAEFVSELNTDNLKKISSQPYSLLLCGALNVRKQNVMQGLYFSLTSTELMPQWNVITDQ